MMSSLQWCFGLPTDLTPFFCLCASNSPSVYRSFGRFVQPVSISYWLSRGLSLSLWYFAENIQVTHNKQRRSAWSIGKVWNWTKCKNVYCSGFWFIWMDLCNQLCLSDWQLSVHWSVLCVQNFCIAHKVQSFQPNSFIPAMLVGSIWPLSFYTTFSGWLVVAWYPSNMQVYRWDRSAQTVVCAATLK